MQPTFHPLISVVVPFYNLEAYAKRCVDSLIAQTYDNFELVLVDDGSMDDTPAILDSYGAFQHVKVLHFENGGLSAARNRGVAAAGGEFITFVDGDDYVSPRYLEFLVGGIGNESNVLVVSIEHVVPHSAEAEWSNEHPIYNRFTREQAIRELAYDRIKTAAVGKLAPRALYENVYFPEGHLYEEISTAGDFILSVDEVVVFDLPVYAYVMNGGSIVNRRSARYSQVEDYDRAITLICAAIQKSGCDHPEEAILYQRSLQFMRMMPLLNRVDDDRVEAVERWSQLICELRRITPVVFRDSRAGVSHKARLVLAAYAPSVYIKLINIRDSRRTR